MNLTKFGSLNLDTPRISYDFYKFVAISGKQLKKTSKFEISTRTQLSEPAATNA